MACYNPLVGYRAEHPNPDTGKFPIRFKPTEGYYELKRKLPCGWCIGCRLQKSREWAIRVAHEASLYDQNSFITLTYSPENLPGGVCDACTKKENKLKVHAPGSLCYQAPVLFMKRLREKFGEGIRSFGCAEYGEKLQRPHYHLCLLNFDFGDKVQFKKFRGSIYYRSDELEKLWPFGYSLIGDLTFESAAYVARYVMKKFVNKDPAKESEHYDWTCPTTGEILERERERAVCVSRRPGLGRPWLDRFHSDVYPKDSFHFQGREMRPPRYYDYRFELENPEVMEEIKGARRKAAFASRHDATDARLEIREKVAAASLQNLSRPFERGL